MGGSFGAAGMVNAMVGAGTCGGRPMMDEPVAAMLGAGVRHNRAVV